MKMKMKMVFTFFIFIISIHNNLSAAVDTLATNQTLSDDGGTMLVSASQTFVLGFFSPWSSRNRYLGIWVRNEPERTVVWVANNNNPISDFSGVLRLTPTGDLIISSTKNHQVANIVWLSNSSALFGKWLLVDWIRRFAIWNQESCPAAPGQR
ncbi:G-type lectin S-receptor-like serine/threonine-protein kinase At4g27290 [Ipomoea triloba]|uniref:G-type lectin S-receptor-like serine/threonine-protein kinase At4g27290 n=1 Tax=Ipomoea triloba TaxID=35885 RepID=UPI00125CDB14|nr:G-type lectin S-receptor-like serine/threonine-protein kinase At4g27290 [Ipomoea triloba]